MASFMNAYKKDLKTRSEKAGSDLIIEAKPPMYYANCGNYSLNKLVTGEFVGALPQGRLVCFAGHSSSGKSLVGGSALAQTIKDGGIGLLVDSENACDDQYMMACGVDVESDNYQYVGVSTIRQTTAEVNNFLKAYRKAGETTRAVILVDSLDMLMTDTEAGNIEKTGIIKGDQGQQAKQLKAMLKTWVHSLKGLNVTIVCTKQVYVEQDDTKSKNEPWKFTESLKFAFTHIVMIEKLVFKKEESGTKVHKGFTLKARSYKSRKGRENQVVKIEVPFDDGMKPYSGLIEIAEEFKVVTNNSGWYAPLTYEGKKFQRTAAEADSEFMEMLLAQIIAVNTEDMAVNANLEDYVSVEGDAVEEAPAKPISDDDLKEGLAKKRKTSKAKKAKATDE